MENETQQKFLNEIQSFITNHPYYKQQQGETLEIPQMDKTQFTIDDPDGDYESITIIIEAKP